VVLLDEGDAGVFDTVVRRLYDEFASRGVDFILVVRTTGSFGLSTTLSPQAERDSLRAYYCERRKIPGILAIQETQFVVMPDGRKAPVDLPAVSYGIVTPDGLVWGHTMLATPAGYEDVRAFLTSQLERQAQQAQHATSSP
jgi:hypothetical protein